MGGLNMRSRIILFVLVLVLAINCGISFAQIQDWSTLWTLNLGYGQVKNETIDKNIDAYSFNTTVEQMIPVSDFSLGANLGWFSTAEVLRVSEESKSWETYSSTSFFITGKYHFQRDKQWVPYIGLGVGFHISNVEYAISGVLDQDRVDGIMGKRSIGSIALAGALGINLTASESMFIGFNFAPIWFKDTYYKDNLFYLINLSLGFQFN
jgi:hypothetical protein